ncbi:maleylpyruvate isomerase family mycothiol-dependent enzyme [Mycobacterium sp.]|uniref:maleylpyruvate isomerase family mycothiol-dependent enzyme n=1 Tax=Mycobacterium sp. TaxID=1785 RepID=UPI003F98F33D
MADELGQRHLAVCRRFGDAVRAADGKWHRRSPCDAWDASGVLEHVIGFHDLLLLRPLGLKPDRPREDPQIRWELTYRALETAFEPGRRLFERVVEVPQLHANPATSLDARAMMPNLTRDVLVHTWDLARAVGADDRLDAEWCEQFYSALPSDPQALSVSGMFDAPVAVSDHADVQSKLLARLGRNPGWQPHVPRFPCVAEPQTGPVAE